MKRLVLFMMTVMVMGSAAMAQEAHQKFMGIPMEGKVAQFSQKLQQKGMKKIMTQNGTEVLKGTFATMSDCLIFVMGGESGQVSRVSVAFPSKDRWSDLSSDYDALKDLLTQKYGKPSLVVEEVNAGYSENDVLHHLMMDQATWACGWSTDKGKIELEVKVVNLDCMVVLSYYDEINHQIQIDKVLEEL